MRYGFCAFKRSIKCALFLHHIDSLLDHYKKRAIRYHGHQQIVIVYVKHQTREQMLRAHFCYCTYITDKYIALSAVPSIGKNIEHQVVGMPNVLAMSSEDPRCF